MVASQGRRYTIAYQTSRRTVTGSRHAPDRFGPHITAPQIAEYDLHDYLTT
jgi:hypothetical protein